MYVQYIIYLHEWLIFYVKCEFSPRCFFQNFTSPNTLGAQVDEEMTLGPLRKAIEGRVRRGD